MTLPLVRVPRIILSECNERLVAQRAESDGGGPCFRVASSVHEELRALLGAVDGAIMLLELCGWRVSRVAFVEKASGSSKSDVLDLDASSWLRTPRQSAADATWAVPVISGPSAASFANTSRWELQFELGGHPGVSERFRVDLTGLSGRLRVEADGTVVQSVTSGVAIGADGAFAELHGAGGLADQLLQRLGALLAATPDLDRPGDGSGMLGLWATGEWRSGPRGSAGILREWIAWLGPLRIWMTSALTDATARADFLRAIALPRARGGLSVVEHVEKIRGAGQPMREPASLDLVAVHRAIEDSLSSEGRWRSQGNFQNAILKSLSLGDLLLLLQNEGVIDTLNAVSIDPLLGLDILDAIAGGHVPSDLEWSVVMAFVRQYPTHVRAREAVAALIAAAAGHPVTFRVEVYESLLSVLAVAPYSPGPPEGPPTVDECGAWLLDLLLIDTAAEDLEGYLLGTRAALDRKLSGAQADDRFARALIEFGLFHPDVAARYSAAQTAAAVYAALGGTGADDPGRAALRARFDDLCALATTCAGWDRELGSVDPGNALADDLEAIMDALGLLEPNLDGIDWREVDRRTEQRLQAALLADAGDIKRPDQYYTPGTGYTFDRQTQPYLLLLAACEMARDSGPEPRFSSGLRRRFDPLSAERVLDELRRSSGVLRDLFARAPLLARDEVVAETFPDRSIEAIFDAHEAALLDECTVAWVATMPPEPRSKFVDGRILPMLAVDMARARDVAASFAIRLAARDPASAFGDFSPTEGDRLADLTADAAPDGTDLQEARKFGTGLVRISGPTIYHARFALSLQEALHKKLRATAGQSIANARVARWIQRPGAPSDQALKELYASADALDDAIKEVERWKVASRSLGTLFGLLSIVVRCSDDSINRLDTLAIAKDVASTVDNLGAVAGSSLIFDFSANTKWWIRFQGRGVGVVYDGVVLCLKLNSAVEHCARGEYDRAMVDAVYAASAALSLTVGLYVLFWCTATLETPPLALAILTVGGLLSLGAWCWETFVLPKSEAQQFMDALEAWLVSVRVVYPDPVALYPPLIPGTTTVAEGGAGFYGMRPLQVDVGLDWTHSRAPDERIVAGEVLAHFRIATDVGIDVFPFEFIAPLSGNFQRVTPGSVKASGDAVLYLLPDFTDRRPT